MKKMMLCALMMMVAICAKAQFEAGTKYVGISATNLGLSYSSSENKIYKPLQTFAHK